MHLRIHGCLHSYSSLVIAVLQVYYRLYNTCGRRDCVKEDIFYWFKFTWNFRRRHYRSTRGWQATLFLIYWKKYRQPWMSSQESCNTCCTKTVCSSSCWILCFTYVFCSQFFHFQKQRFWKIIQKSTWINLISSSHSCSTCR